MRRYSMFVLAGVAGAIITGLLAGCSKGAVAVVNGRKITEDEFHQRLETMEGGRTLYDMIAREILTREAEAQGVQVSAAQVDQELARWQEQFPTLDDFLKHLSDRGQTIEQFRDERTFAIMLETLATRNVQVSEEDVRKQFEENREFYDRPAECRISEIVTDTREDADDVRTQLDDPRASFDALARERSKSPSSAAGGGLPPRAVRDYPDEWQDVLEGMAVGDISQPFKTDQGWRIVKLLAMTPPRPASLDDPDTRERVFQTIRLQRAKNPNELLQEAIMKGNHRVVIRWDKYKDLERQFAPPPDVPVLGGPGLPPSGGQESTGPEPEGLESAPPAPPAAEKAPQPTTE